jgi:RNA polymerase sigma-70 factor, ECF subfamily
MAQDLTEIWREVHDSLRGFIAKHVRNEVEANDILQEVFLRVHRHLDRLSNPDRVMAWLYQITRNAIVDYYRSPGRRREVPVGLAGDVETTVPVSLPSDDESCQLRTELAACLRPMLDRLSKDYREAVMMVELQGLTQQAAARRLGLSLSGMKSRVQRGRKQLKEVLDECCLIQLDRRGGVADYEIRDVGCDPCRGSETRSTRFLVGGSPEWNDRLFRD